MQEAFGAAGILPESAIEMNLRLPGQYFDRETGTHYNFLRNYRLDIGRYLQDDPIGIYGGLNVFVYSNNNPLSNVDTFGLRAGEGCIKIPFGPLIKRSREEIERRLLDSFKDFLIIPVPELGPNLDPRDGVRRPGFKFPLSVVSFYLEIYRIDVYENQRINVLQYFQEFAQVCTYLIKVACREQKVTETKILPAEYVGDGSRTPIGRPFITKERRMIFRAALPFLGLPL